MQHLTAPAYELRGLGNSMIRHVLTILKLDPNRILAQALFISHSTFRSDVLFVSKAKAVMPAQKWH
jgi:hypothetical protein